jgi:Protein of unknown function (DUF2806)
MPENDDTDPASIISKLNLPEMIAGQAGKALSRLVASVTDIPASYLQGKAQKIKDGTDARSAVSKAVAKAAAKQAAEDPAIVDRAVEALIASEYRKQKNKEAIATRTIEILQDSPSDTESQPPPEIDPDWMNIFEQYAQNASSERLQDIWARVLSGEIRKPKTFSPKTLGFIAELDQEVARVFEKHANAIINNDFIPKPGSLSGDVLTEFLLLEDFGLISGTFGFLSKNVTLSEIGNTFRYRTHGLHIFGTAGKTVNISALNLTRVGKEIASILPLVDDVARAKEFVEICPKQDLEKIIYGQIQYDHRGLVLINVETLWEKEQPAAPAD